MSESSRSPNKPSYAREASTAGSALSRGASFPATEPGSPGQIVSIRKEDLQEMIEMAAQAKAEKMIGSK